MIYEMNYTKMTANELCQAYKDGDEHAFTALYKRYNPMVKARLNKLVKHDKEEIDDITQEVWSTAARYIKQSFEFKASFTTYLYTIVRTRYINQFRYRKPNYITDQDKDDFHFLFYSIAEHSHEQEFSFNESQVEDLTDAFQSIDVAEVADMYLSIEEQVVGQYPEREQLIYYSRDAHDTSLKEAAETLGLSYWTVKTISSKVGRKIDKQVTEQFNEQFRNHYQNY
jgi:RNA polymerase sigma factor (sigma-70 family)